MDAAPPPAVVASSPRSATACLPQPYRWQDRCDENSGGLKHVALDGAEDIWLTFGGELRERVETIDRPEFGTRRAPGYTANDIRALVEADLRTAAGPRLFVQLATAADDGRAVVRSFDRSAPDVQQAFVDLPFRAGGLLVTARVGRQEVDLGDDRLVASREPANLRLAFDMAQLQIAWRFGRVTAFYGRPVVNAPGAFDDHRDRGEAFSGASVQFGTPASRWSGAAFGFYRDRRTAVALNGVGPDRRGTLGGRVAYRGSRLDAKVEAVYQLGTSLGRRVSATGVTAEVGWSWPTLPGRPRLSLIGGRASGDHDPRDGVASDFDPLYPRLGYFTDAPVLYPRNIWDVAPTFRISPTRRTWVQVGVVLVGRLARGDALYGATSLPLPGSVGGRAGLAATLPYLSFHWTISPHLAADGSIVTGQPHSGLDPVTSRALTYGLFQIAYRF